METTEGMQTLPIMEMAILNFICDVTSELCLYVIIVITILYI